MSLDGWELPAELQAYVDAQQRVTQEEYEQVARFAAMLCRCRPWYDHRDPCAAQEDCYVHTTLALTRHGTFRLA